MNNTDELNLRHDLNFVNVHFSIPGAPPGHPGYFVAYADGGTGVSNTELLSLWRDDTYKMVYGENGVTCNKPTKINHNVMIPGTGENVLEVHESAIDMNRPLPNHVFDHHNFQIFEGKVLHYMGNAHYECAQIYTEFLYLIKPLRQELKAYDVHPDPEVEELRPIVDEVLEEWRVWCVQDGYPYTCPFPRGNPKLNARIGKLKWDRDNGLWPSVIPDKRSWFDY